MEDEKITGVEGGGKSSRGRFELTAEERAEILEAIEEARRTQPAYVARMRNFGRHTEDTMKRRFNV